jgi:hypothetical protein
MIEKPQDKIICQIIPFEFDFKIVKLPSAQMLHGREDVPFTKDYEISNV